MMNGSEKSESPIRAMKLANKAAMTAAESTEQRGDAKGNASTTTTRRTQCRESVSSGLARVRKIAKEQPKLRFTALMHHLTLELLRQSYFLLKRNAAPGIDGVTWEAYGERLDEHIVELHARVHRGAYRALPSRRKMIPKPDGRERPLGIASLEDKIVQRAMVEMLNEIYEADFLGFSYGFRPGRGQHDALDALAYAITRTPVNWIIDADLRAFFDTVNHDWLIRFLELRIGDNRVIRLIRKWLKAGVMDGLNALATTKGTPQGSVISPLLANVYLHYCFDLWVDRWRKKNAIGNVVVVRYADDIVVGAQRYNDATKLMSELKKRLAMFSLELHPQKTRLIEFGRWADERRRRSGRKKPEPFAFLGFLHICGKSRKGSFLLRRQTRSDRMRITLHAIREQLRKRMHETTEDQGRWLQSVVRGYFAYHAVPTNGPALCNFRHRVTLLWRHALSRRSQNAYTPWRTMASLVNTWLPKPRVIHPWPQDRFAANHPR
ncbi:MAG: group II intron reverse transcriptase/maturase [Candidatus Eremiobacteraeota bacterium]|nr:group II intron reverse transcriptase/maturase [Candidatus Eremiobacteraeota bacterium]